MPRIALLCISRSRQRNVEYRVAILPASSIVNRLGSRRDRTLKREVVARPKQRPSERELNDYNYFRRNVAGVQREWWYHRSGCRTWFLAERDTRTNEVLSVSVPAPGGRATSDPGTGIGQGGAHASGAGPA